MPYHAFQVTSARHEHHRAESSSGDSPQKEAYDETVIWFKIPNEDLRPFGRVLYGLLGIFYVPLFIDVMWDFVYDPYMLEENEAISLQQCFVDTVKSSLRSPLECLNFLLAPLVVVLCAFVTALRMVFHLFFNGFLPFTSLCCRNIHYVFVDPPDDAQKVQRSITRSDDGEVDYDFELKFRLRHHLEAGYGQTIAVGFGPFAHWCLFRANPSFPDGEK